MISPLFTTIVLVSLIICIYMKLTVKGVGSGISDFLDKESRANNVRKQPLDSLSYINFTDSSVKLPKEAPNTRIESLCETLQSLYFQKIVNLSGISNTDLKLTYGAANLPLLSEYDQNFTTLSRTLYDLAIELISEGMKDEAKSILEYGVSIGTDISGHYLTLANLYVEANDFDKINHLIAAAENMHSLTKSSTITKLQEILDTHTTVVIAQSAVLPASEKSHEQKVFPKPVLPSSNESPDSMLPKDILDILDFVNDTANDQKP